MEQAYAYCTSLIGAITSTKRKREEEVPSTASPQPGSRRDKAQQRHVAGEPKRKRSRKSAADSSEDEHPLTSDQKYRFQMDYLRPDEINEGQGIISRAVLEGGRRAIRVEALAFKNLRKPFQTIRLDLVTESTETNVELDPEDLQMLMNVVSAALGDRAMLLVASPAATTSFKVDPPNGVFKATREGEDGTRSFLLKTATSRTDLFDFVVTYTCPFKFSLQSHVKGLQKVDIEAWLECIQSLISATRKAGFPSTPNTQPTRPPTPMPVRRAMVPIAENPTRKPTAKRGASVTRAEGAKGRYQKKSRLPSEEEESDSESEIDQGKHGKRAFAYDSDDSDEEYAHTGGSDDDGYDNDNTSGDDDSYTSSAENDEDEEEEDNSEEESQDSEEEDHDSEKEHDSEDGEDEEEEGDSEEEEHESEEENVPVSKKEEKEGKKPNTAEPEQGERNDDKVPEGDQKEKDTDALVKNEEKASSAPSLQEGLNEKQPLAPTVSIVEYSDPGDALTGTPLGGVEEMKVQN